MYGEFLRLLFLQAHRETESHFTADGRANRAGTRASLVGCLLFLQEQIKFIILIPGKQFAIRELIPLQLLETRRFYNAVW